jgi:hypothetical protein
VRTFYPNTVVSPPVLKNSFHDDMGADDRYVCHMTLRAAYKLSIEIFPIMFSSYLEQQLSGCLRNLQLFSSSFASLALVNF